MGRGFAGLQLQGLVWCRMCGFVAARTAFTPCGMLEKAVRKRHPPCSHVVAGRMLFSVWSVGVEPVSPICQIRSDSAGMVLPVACAQAGRTCCLGLRSVWRVPALSLYTHIFYTHFFSARIFYARTFSARTFYVCSGCWRMMMSSCCGTTSVLMLRSHSMNPQRR